MPRDERPLDPDLNDPRIPEALASGELELLGLLPNSSNYTFLARATAGDDHVLAVYKPRRGEMPLWDFPEGTLCRREVAAYVVARELGWPNVPPTLLREGPEGLGSAQLFVEFDPSHHYFTLEGTHAAEFRRVALFDMVVNNADRKGGHCLLAPDGTIWVVDHGVCFNEEPKLRTVIWEHVGEQIPAELLDDVRALRERLQLADLRAELDELLSSDELIALDERIDSVLATGVFPEPGPGRPYPLAAGVTGYRSTSVPTPLGDMTVVVSDRGVVWTTFTDDDVGPEQERLEQRLGSSIFGGGARALTPLRREVEDYFRGTGRTFETPVDLMLVPDGFGRRVLEATMAIPYGELATYGDVAASAGSLRAGRAAGGALSRCPIELFVPCHRVVHAGGTIGGYGRHEDRKRWLLRHEGAV